MLGVLVGVVIAVVEATWTRFYLTVKRVLLAEAKSAITQHSRIKVLAVITTLYYNSSGLTYRGNVVSGVNVINSGST
jgi:hypothetical protein